MQPRSKSKNKPYFLANYLPPTVLHHIQLDSLTITKDSFVDKEHTAHYSDLLYQVTLTGDRPGFVYFLFEHKSYPDRFVSLQLLRHVLEIWKLAQGVELKTLSNLDYQTFISDTISSHYGLPYVTLIKSSLLPGRFVGFSPPIVICHTKILARNSSTPDSCPICS